MAAKRTAAKGSANGKGAAAGKGARRSATVEVKLGHIAANGISASLYGLIERGAAKRPKIAKSLRGAVEIRFKEDFAPVHVSFAPSGVTVGDGHDEAKFRPDLVIHGSLPDIVQLASAPLFGGVPKPTDARGRAALARVAGGKVKIEGSPLLARRVLKLLEI